jgi:hypothetical protein
MSGKYSDFASKVSGVAMHVFLVQNVNINGLVISSIFMCRCLRN